MKFFFLGISLLFTANLIAQLGCTDVQAINFDESASENNGSCLYADTILKPSFILQLPDEIQEISGMYNTPNGIWCHNDSGSDSILFKFDPNTGDILDKKFVVATNTDWEEMAYDDTYIYLGDFGNNNQIRKDLVIHKMKINDLDSVGPITTEKIYFSYADQTDFTFSDMNHNFDCEAMFIYENEIYLFSKNWENQKTRLYKLPTVPGNYEINPIGSWDPKGLISGAEIRADKKLVVLTGYDGNQLAGNSFVVFLSDFKPGDFLSGNKRRIDLGRFLNIGQLESVVFDGLGNLILASENSFVLTPKLHKLPYNSITNTNSIKADIEFAVNPNPCTEYLEIIFNNPQNDTVEIEIINISGQVRYRNNYPPNQNGVIRIQAVKNLKPGPYIVHCKIGDKMFKKKILKI